MTSQSTSDAVIYRTPAAARVFLSLLERIRVGHLVLVTPAGERKVFGSPAALPGVTLQIHDWRSCSRILKMVISVLQMPTRMAGSIPLI